MKRDAISRDDAWSRIRSQMPIEEKKKMADIVINNSQTLDVTRKRALEVFKELKHSFRNLS
jgi:dephospho-CoA kinase